jgi:hypothetical protein
MELPTIMKRGEESVFFDAGSHNKYVRMDNKEFELQMPHIIYSQAGGMKHVTSKCTYSCNEA